jgi:hypothetical protein
MIDSRKVEAVIALGDDLSALGPDDARYTAMLESFDRAWEALTAAEQDEVDRILRQRRKG